MIDLVRLLGKIVDSEGHILIPGVRQAVYLLSYSFSPPMEKGECFADWRVLILMMIVQIYDSVRPVTDEERALYPPIDFDPESYRKVLKCL
jgi:hypothetical protein